ncbi:MAG: MBL fold metallo-hydrolase [Oscillospiraceae bacterium]|nr:MBL fold metallo-hydrolase [Oscillospiraceae bacterium]
MRHPKRSKESRKIRRKIIPLTAKAWWSKYWFPLILLAVVVIGVSVYLLKNRETPVECTADDLCVYVLDVGQGDCTILYNPDTAILIDGGEAEYGTKVLDALRALKIRRLDAVINSHPHSDHLGGLNTVLENIPTDMVYQPTYPDTLIPTGYNFERFLELVQEQHLQIVNPNCGETAKFGQVEITFFCIDNSLREDLNDCSLVCRITHGDNSFLFTGDISKEAEQDFLAAELIAPSKFLKCAHHGSGNSSSNEFLDAVSPKIAVISVGAFNDYGHPSDACLERLFARTDSVYRTDIDGTILFFSNGKTIQPNTHVTFK